MIYYTPHLWTYQYFDVSETFFVGGHEEHVEFFHFYPSISLKWNLHCIVIGQKIYSHSFSGGFVFFFGGSGSSESSSSDSLDESDLFSSCLDFEGLPRLFVAVPFLPNV